MRMKPRMVCTIFLIVMIPATLFGQGRLGHHKMSDRSVVAVAVGLDVRAGGQMGVGGVGQHQFKVWKRGSELGPISLASAWPQGQRPTSKWVSKSASSVHSPSASHSNVASSANYPRIEPEKGRVLFRRAVLASAALAATSAAIAHWSSGRGDEAYDRYLSSAGEQRREDAFDEAERYDRIAGAAFFAMEAGLVLSAYFVFF
ncbi:MAG: hypothetical protein CME13_15450 [Gemmatimonadetes bacterium]|jgi:hypothetical protein|nr:hypothetical protein [Gemmatimonadota bacterium]HCV25167.1 hypothetical protein [Candidatus Latescibacterota bacterium]